MKRKGIFHYGLHISANPVPSSTRNGMQSHLGQKKGDRQEANVEANVLLASKTLTPPSSRTRELTRPAPGQMFTAERAKPGPEPTWKRRASEALPVSVPRHSRARCGHGSTSCTRGRSAALPRYPQTRTSRLTPGTPRSRGKRRCSPERRRSCRPAGARYLGVLLGQLLVLPLQLRRRRHLRPAGWAALDSAGLGWTRLGRTRALPPAPHAREWQDALPGSGRRERGDVTAPCARRQGRTFKPPTPPS